MEKLFLVFTHVEGITLVAGKAVYEVAGGASGMGVGRVDEVGDRASEGQAARMYGAGFTAGSLARKGAWDGMRGIRNNVSSDKELMKVAPSEVNTTTMKDKMYL